MCKHIIHTTARTAARLTLCGMLILVLSATACTQGPPEPDHTAEIEALMETLLHDDDPDERRWAAATLGQHGDAMAVPALLEALRQDENSRVRTQAVTSLGMIGDPEAVDDLVDALEKGDEDMRRQATRALGEIRDERSVEALRHALRTDGSPYVRQLAAWALGRTGADSAVEPLVEALQTDGASFVRRGAAAALGALGAERSTEPLIDALQDSDAMVRWESLKALTSVGEPAVEALTVTLGEGHEATAWYAVFALEKIGTPDATGQVDQFLEHQSIDLEEASQNYRAGWSYEVIVLMLERHGTEEMARY